MWAVLTEASRVDAWLFALDVTLVLYFARVVARRSFPDTPWSAALPLAWSLVIGTLVVLATFGALRPWTVTLAFATAAVGSRGAGWGSPSAAPPARLRLPGRATLVLLLPAVFWAPYLLRSIGAPPRAWDALTYHLPRAAHWVEVGGLRPEVGPDALRYYEFFPVGGDLVFAWTFLAGRGDALLFLVYAAFALGIVTSAWALARAMGARRGPALLGAANVALLPCVLHLGGSAYVDGLGLSLQLFSAAFLLRAVRARRAAAPATLALLTAGAAAAVKTSGLPTLLLCFAVCVALVVRGRLRARTLLVAGGAAWLPFVCIAAWTFRHTGSPVYPLPLRVLGHEVFAGNPLLQRTLTATSGSFQLSRFFDRMFLEPATPVGGHLNFGVSGLLLLPLGLGALPTCRRLSRAQALLVLSLVVVTAAPLFGAPAFFNGPFARQSGRLASPAIAILACCLAASRHRIAHVAAILVLLAAVPMAFPSGIAAWEISPRATAIGLACVGFVVLAGFAPRGRALLTTLGVVLAPFAFDALATARAPLRAPEYASLGRAETWEFNPAAIGAHYGLWAWLETLPARRLAYSGGFHPPHGHHIFRYGLYGARLQHSVTYVSPTVDGTTPDWALGARPAMDADVYADRLLAAGVTELVLAERPPELALVEGAPHRFAPVDAGSAPGVFRPLPRAAAPSP